MLRLFVGIPIPEAQRDQLKGLCGGLPGARWVDPASLHLTLRFVGEIDGGAARDLDDALSQVRAPGFDLLITGIDCFEQGGKVHTLWTGVGTQPFLVHLRDKIESAVVRSGQPPERRRFRPHITLARFKNGSGERIGPFLQRYSRFSTEAFAVEHFTLFRSHLLSGGAHYEPLAEYPLDARRDAASPP